MITTFDRYIPTFDSQSRDWSPSPSPPAMISPPWKQYEAPVRPVELRSRSPASSYGGSLLDQVLARQTRRNSPTETAVIPPTSLSQSSTPRDHRSVASLSPTPKKQGRGRAMYVPCDEKQDGSIGGSPPDSDANSPSVLLPHSAVRHIQRPVPFDDTDSLQSSSQFSRSSSSTIAPSLASRMGPSLAARLEAPPLARSTPSIVRGPNGRAGVRNTPFASSSNTVPLGGRGAGRDTGTEDRLYGFKVRGAAETSRKVS